MALRISKTDGDWNDMATWGGIHNTPDLHASNLATIGGGVYYTDTFTAPSTVDMCLGAAFYISTPDTTITDGFEVQLQEYDGTTWNDVGAAMVYSNDIEYVSGTDDFWVYLEGVNYTFTTTTADYYRYAIVRYDNGAYRLGESASGNIAFISVDDTNVSVPTAGDNVFVFHTIQVDSDINIGTGTEVNNNADSQANGLLNAIQVSGALEFASDATRTVTCNGHFFVARHGSVWIGSEASPLDDGNTVTFTFTNTTDERGGLLKSGRSSFRAWGLNAHDNNGIQESIIVSGVGTTIDPLVITDAATNWAVGDPLIIEGHLNTESAKKYIRTIVNSTTFTLSDTDGGAESGLTGSLGYAAINGETCLAINVHKNIIFSPYGTNYHRINFADDGDSGDSMLQGVVIGDNMMEGVDDAAIRLFSSKASIEVNGLYTDSTEEEAISIRTTNCTLNHIVVWDANSTTISASGVYMSGAVGNKIQKLRVVSTPYYMVQVNASSLNEFTDMRLNDLDATSSRYALYIVSAHSNKIFGGQIAGIRGVPIYFNNDGLGNQIIGMDISRGQLGSVSYLMRINPSVVAQIAFINCNFHADVLTNMFYPDSLTEAAIGTKVGFQFTNGDENVKVYMPNGEIEKTGLASDGVTSLADPQQSPTGKNCVKFTPVGGGTIQWDFKVMQKAGEDVYLYGQWLHESADPLSYMSGELTRFAEATVADNITVPGPITQWTSGALKASTSVTYNAFAQVKMTIYSQDGLSSVYMGDINAGTNALTEFSLWDGALPSPLMTELAGWDPKSVWDVLASLSEYADNSFGSLVKNELYDSGVYLDVASAYSGTGYLNGSRSRPVNNLADAITIADANTTTTIHLAGTLTLTQDVSGYEFISWKNGKVDINGQDTLATRFKECKVYGAMTASSVGLFFDCRIENLTDMLGVFESCSFLPTAAITLQNGESTLINCVDRSSTGVQFDLTAITASIRAHNISGDFEIINAVTGTNQVAMGFANGTLTIAASCTAGTYIPSGTAQLTNNSTGTTIVKSMRGAIQSEVEGKVIEAALI